MTLHITTPKLPKINRKVLYVAAGLAVIFGLIAYGMVLNVQAERADEVAFLKAEENRRAQAVVIQQHIDNLEAEVSRYKQADSDAIAICQWIDGLVATRKLATAPPLCSRY